MEGVSGNRFILRTRPTKTYINALGAIEIKNPALVRSGPTALQKRIVTKEISRFDFYTQQQLSSAYNLKNSNSVLVDILWGICKYPLFIGFGWPFLPIMLALQYIMSFNYISSNLPLNLDYFLASFRDFRNPSILYNPLRNNFDAKVVNHQNIYKSVPELEEFDRGIDFMKNCWEFFFIPILAFALLGLLFLLNLLFRKCCRRDFCMISKFLVPRAPLLMGAYTLVQALPVSFFFFTQLKDTTFRHPLEPNLAYPTFNTAMAYLAFFLTCTIPILILAWLYYHFNYGSRISEFSDANVFHRKFLNKIDNASGKFSRAQLRDPLWGGDHSKYGTYIFGFAVFGLAIIFGFFIAFFIKDFGWQIAGILFFTVLFLAFTVAASFFVNKVIKVFFIIFMILMLAYLLLHAGIGSNRSIGTYDQWNTGYLGIGILYALLITAILFTAYLLYKFFK